MRGSFKHLFAFLFTLCLLPGFGTVVHARQQDSIPAAQEPVQVRLPDPEKLEAMRASEDFQYYTEVQAGNTFWERIKRKLSNWLQEVFYEGRASGFWEILLYLLLAGTIAYIIIKLQNVDVARLFGRKTASTVVPYEVFEENIHELDLQALIQEAVAQHDFRKAIRLHYLQSLKLLTDRGLIHWKPGKTNRSYVSEIEQPSLRQEFEQLTSMFEYVWYGGAALGDGLFNSARTEFIQFNNHLKQQV